MTTVPPNPADASPNAPEAPARTPAPAWPADRDRFRRDAANLMRAIDALTELADTFLDAHRPADPADAYALALGRGPADDDRAGAFEQVAGMAAALRTTVSCLEGHLGPVLDPDPATVGEALPAFLDDLDDLLAGINGTDAQLAGMRRWAVVLRRLAVDPAPANREPAAVPPAGVNDQSRWLLSHAGVWAVGGLVEDLYAVLREVEVKRDHGRIGGDLAVRLTIGLTQAMDAVSAAVSDEQDEDDE